MPPPPNKALRVIVPMLLIIGSVLVAFAVYVNTSNQSAQKPGGSSTQQAAEQGKTATDAPNTSSTPPSNPPTNPANPAGTPATAGTQTPADTATQPDPAQPATTPPAASTPPRPAKYSPAFHSGPFPAFAPLGALSTPFRMEVRFSPLGAGVASIDLTDVYVTTARIVPERLQTFVPHTTLPRVGVAPFAVDGVEINGEFVGLFGQSDQEGTYWTQTKATADTSTFEALINDSAGNPAVRVTRSYRLQPDSYDLILEQRAANLTAEPMTIVWREWGPSDLPRGHATGMDYRRVRFGYLTDPATDPSQQIVRADKFVDSRSDWLGSPSTTSARAGGRVWDARVLWPNDTSTQRKLTPVWVAMTNRHFTVAMHTLLEPAATGTTYSKPLKLASRVERYVLDGLTTDSETMALYLTSEPATVPPGQAGVFDAGVYAGPISPQYMTENSEPRAWLVSLSEIVVYTMGGPCWWCTFQWLTHPLQWFLTFLHNNVVFDYALAIIVLVVCVRTVLHPVTKWSQISMMRFSKQMSAIAPKQKQIQEKYKGDPVKMREELGRLMREENISYAGLLGCVPSFLQSPIWIALYAMLYFMYELRHEPGFFGAFQGLSTAVTGHSWSFLADLSEPDRFIPLGFSFSVPLMGVIDSINLLPILLGVVFFVQQKYMTPPSTATLTPEQEQQQKIVKVMMVVMFPLLMYNTPSALVLYFIANSTLGTLESRYIRRHATAQDLMKTDVIAAGVGTSVIDRKDRKPARKPGFMERVQQLAQERARQIEEAKRRQGRK